MEEELTKFEIFYYEGRKKSLNSQIISAKNRDKAGQKFLKSKEIKIDSILDMNQIYIDHGFKNREHYLSYLSLTYGKPLSDICKIAKLYPKEDEFDGLVNYLEDLINHPIETDIDYLFREGEE